MAMAVKSYFGEYYRYLNLYEDAQQDIIYWKDIADQRQRTIEFYQKYFTPKKRYTVLQMQSDYQGNEVRERRWMDV